MISTGLLKLDNFLSGGIPNGIIVDIFGGMELEKLSYYYNYQLIQLKMEEMFCIWILQVVLDLKEF